MAEVESRSLELRSVAIAFWVLAFVASVLRVYARAIIMKAFSVDDWLMMLAMLAFTINTTTCVLGTIQGSGMHMADLTVPRIQAALMWWFACYPSFTVTMVASKFSVGFYLLRITTSKLHRWIIYVALGLTVIASSTFFFVTLLQCKPISFAWNKVTETGTCIDMDIIIDIVYGYSCLAIVTDFTFTLLPAWLVFHLQMDLKTKLALTVVIGMACIASAAVLVRFPHINDFRDPDFLWASTTIAVWSQVEAGLAIAAGSFATLRPLFRMLLVKFGLTTNTVPTYGRGGVQYNNNYNIGASGYNKSRAGGATHNAFSMATFNRMDDVTDDDDSQRGVGGHAGESTADLHKGAKEDKSAGDYTVQVVSAAKGFDAAAHAHTKAPGGHKGLQIHYTKEYGSDAH
ncbi:hypothetical protein Micbo1qcDRAFT_213625 [Microdochium bolleyi]|uniref:Rhodopsin domain-containing protein n=1 Tax=Microdochium bolleyi TaxID=196109 RepID=A0A136II49_9PEZI|nr:hypothetical protein Micbo1qcDRAFT_213625 [Microdochium bolleyi]